MPGRCVIARGGRTGGRWHASAAGCDAARCNACHDLPRLAAMDQTRASEDKIIYGSEVPIWHPQWALKAFADFQLP